MPLMSDKAQIDAALAELIALIEAGQPVCAALRVFRDDGTVQEIVIADSEEEEAAMIAQLRAGEATDASEVNDA